MNQSNLRFVKLSYSYYPDKFQNFKLSKIAQQQVKGGKDVIIEEIVDG